MLRVEPVLLSNVVIARTDTSRLNSHWTLLTGIAYVSLDGQAKQARSFGVFLWLVCMLSTRNAVYQCLLQGYAKWMLIIAVPDSLMSGTPLSWQSLVIFWICSSATIMP